MIVGSVSVVDDPLHRGRDDLPARDTWQRHCWQTGFQMDAKSILPTLGGDDWIASTENLQSEFAAAGREVFARISLSVEGLDVASQLRESLDIGEEQTTGELPFPIGVNEADVCLSGLFQRDGASAVGIRQANGSLAAEFLLKVSAMGSI